MEITVAMFWKIGYYETGGTLLGSMRTFLKPSLPKPGALPEEQLLGYFLCGLKPELRWQIQVHNPKEILRAVEIACAIEWGSSWKLNYGVGRKREVSIILHVLILEVIQLSRWICCSAIPFNWDPRTLLLNWEKVAGNNNASQSNSSSKIGREYRASFRS